MHALRTVCIISNQFKVIEVGVFCKEASFSIVAYRLFGVCYFQYDLAYSKKPRYPDEFTVIISYVICIKFYKAYLARQHGRVPQRLERLPTVPKIHRSGPT